MFSRVPMSQTVRRLTRHARRGFTLPELMIVVVIISLLALVAVPKVSAANGKRNLESARLRVASALVTARQAAIQKGQTVQFQISAHMVRVHLNTDTLNLLSPIPLDRLYSVRTGGDVTVDFSARGFANQSGPTNIILTGLRDIKDTVVVTKTGMVQQ
jgi:prepilin-type N-terminal cleavage/methylation domain-containing protein